MLHSTKCKRQLYKICFFHARLARSVSRRNGFAPRYFYRYNGYKGDVEDQTKYITGGVGSYF